MSRMRYIAAVLNQAIRFVGLSTALANAADLADWLGISSKVGGFHLVSKSAQAPGVCLLRHLRASPAVASKGITQLLVCEEAGH